jgi:hypothetical protein
MHFDFEFDFEHWRKLAEENPDRYFAERKQLIERFMAAAPSRMVEDLQHLQSLIDHSRLEAGTPMLAVRQMLGMLGDYLEALAGQVQALKHQSHDLVASLSRQD